MTNQPNQMTPAAGLAIAAFLLTQYTAVMKHLQDKRARKEMTPEEEAQQDALEEAAMKQPWWNKSTAPNRTQPT